MKQTLLNLFVFVPLLIASRTIVSGDTLQGEAFTDPDFVLQMPVDWQSRPIHHEKKVDQVDLIVTLDQHLYQFLPQAIYEYARVHALKVTVMEGTCGITAGKLVRKTVDIGGYCCPPGITDRLPGLRFHTIGILPIEILVHPDNPIDNISLQEAREIFQGSIYRWSEIKDSRGQPGLSLIIQTIGRLHCKRRPGHWRLLLDNEDLFGPRLQEVGTIPDMISLVADAQDAIGYEVGMMVKRYRNEGKVKSLMIDGQAPTATNLLTGRYPLYRTLNLTTWKGKEIENPKAERLVEFLLKLENQLEEQFDLVPAAALHKAGWQFRGNELIGGPQ